MATMFYDTYYITGVPIGRMEPDGKVYDDPIIGVPIGMVDPEGNVWDNPYYGGNKVGYVDNSGRIYRTLASGICVARVTRDGMIYKSIFDSTFLGRVDGKSKLYAGAALYLLILGKDE